MRRLALTCLGLVVAVGCRGCDKPIEMPEAGFRVEETELDFGRVLEGTVAKKPVHVVSTSVVGLSLTLTTDAPFAVQETLELEGGANVPVEISFVAGSTHEERELKVSSPGGDVKVTLKATGVHPLDCTPSAPCRESHYVLETNSCFETVMVNGTDCTPTSTCLERGQCLDGLCQGVARSCDDNNKCTIDGCAEGLGCVNAQRPCPPPTVPCRVSICDPSVGCSDTQAQDYTPCGAVDCVMAQICLGGTCQTISTPEGFPCSPPTPCQGMGTCRMQQCLRPDAGVMAPELVLPIGGAPPASRPMLLSFAGQLYGQVCGFPLPPVPNTVDAGDDDAGTDAGRIDAGFHDGGIGCVLLSYTNNGFERFTQPFGDERERTLLYVSNFGAALLGDGGMEFRSLANGQLRLQVALPGAVHPKGVASTVLSEPWLVMSLEDAGTSLYRVETDGGALTALVSGLDASVALLAIDEGGSAWLAGDSTVGYVTFDDAGVALGPGWTSAAPPANTTLATTAGYAFAGSTQFVASGLDGGLIMSPTWLDDAGMPLRVQERMNLMSRNRAVVFYRQCPAPMMSCPSEDEELRLRMLSPSTGAVVDDVRVSPANFDARVVEATMLELTGYPPGVAALIQLHRMGIASAYLQLTVGSEGDLTCPLPPNIDIAGAAIGSGYLWAYASRDGGAYALEAYPLTGLPLQTDGWPLADGLAGQRRAR